MDRFVSRPHCRVVSAGSAALVAICLLAPPPAAAADPPEIPAAADVSDVEPTGEIGLRDAVAAALVRNPDLSAFSAEVRAREAHAVQAGMLPNPTLRTDVEDFAGTGERSAFKSAQTTVSLAQLVELGGKRAKRRRVAELEKSLADWDYEARRATVLAEVTKAFVAALAAQERLRLTDQLLGIAGESVKTVGAQVRAGAASPLEQQRADVALARARLERLQLEHDRTAAYGALAATWGARSVGFTSVRGDLARVAAPPPEDAFLANVDANPDLARWAVELEQRRAAIELEEARRIPDVTVALGARRFNENENSAAVLELAIPLPVFDRNQGGIGEARARLSKARAEQAAAEAAVRKGLVEAYQQLHAAYDEVVALRDQVIPRATSVFTGAQDAYAQGLFRFLEVLDAQRTLFELRGQYVQALATFHAARADVERLSGVAVDEPTVRRHDP